MPTKIIIFGWRKQRNHVKYQKCPWPTCQLALLSCICGVHMAVTRANRGGQRPSGEVRQPRRHGGQDVAQAMWPMFAVARPGGGGRPARRSLWWHDMEEEDGPCRGHAEQWLGTVRQRCPAARLAALQPARSTKRRPAGTGVRSRVCFERQRCYKCRHPLPFPFFIFFIFFSLVSSFFSSTFSSIATWTSHIQDKV